MEFLAPYLAGFIFLVMFYLIIRDKFEHHWITLCSGLAVLVLVFGVCMHSFSAIDSTLNLESFFTPSFWYAPHAAAEESSGINWATILFIAGMMIMVEGMAANGFFQWLCLNLAKLVHYRISAIFISFMLMSAFLAMFIDSITVILFLAAATVELAKMLKFDPIPLILAEIFCANLGGAATMCGDPPNIIVGTSLGYTFMDFITNTGVIAGICLIFTVLYFWLCFRKMLKEADSQERDTSHFPDPKTSIASAKGFAMSVLIFLLAIVLLISHASTGLTVAFIGTFIALLTLLCAGKKAPELLKKVDYKTLLFFIGLFIVVGGLEQTGILEKIANLIAVISGGSIVAVIVIILWVSAAASAFVDNIPFAATMIPVIRALSLSQGADLKMLAWTLSIGTDIGGSATPIGASANVVGTAVAIKNGYPVGWKRYCTYCVPATLLVMVLSTLIILVRYVWL